LSFSGVSSLYGGEVRLVSTDLGGPNGMALSPDEKCLYIGKWDEKNKVVMRCEANADGMLSNGQVFCDTTLAPGEDAIDGIKSEP
jgi:gluconolactonase